MAEIIRYASVFIDFGTGKYAAMGSKSCECGHTAANYAANYFVPARVKTRIFTATRKKKRRLSYLCSGFL
jgi:hypothetical protein